MAESRLKHFHEQLHWPESEKIFNPSGAGPSVYARLARQKIEQPLRRYMKSDGVAVGVLMGAPCADGSDAPIAIVCEFVSALTETQLSETRRLAWNFCRAPLLITIEPQLVRVWSCYERPEGDTGRFEPLPIEERSIDACFDLSPLRESLHWMHLASAQFLQRHADRFKRNERADNSLLENLRYIRERVTADLDETVAHDLLARIIFIQFLFQRKDSNGAAALGTMKLAALHKRGILSSAYRDLADILRRKKDTFALFRWLNTRFNGDLFPSSFSREETVVKKRHLDLLADFVSGDLKMDTGQRLLWPQYSFDTIPLEFISSIYEEFVTKRTDGEEGIGEHYTRPFLVDFILDKVLPWNGDKWQVRILDPCCGSGVFLVKAFQRLVYRWRATNPGKEPPASVLRNLLENWLFGLDVSERAIHVASFSLYLAMCDEIDPRHYWSSVRFPTLRGKTLRSCDFFSEEAEGIRCKEDASSYDRIIGNAPWGKDSLTDLAKEWANAHNWPTVGEQSGVLFLAKAACLCRPRGRISMIQPSGSLLFNIAPTALAFRKKLFSRFKVDEVVNLSDLRFLKLFPKAVGPACIITMRPVAPTDDRIAYWSPKQIRAEEGQYRVVIDEQDLNWVWPDEAADDPVVWPALTWGGRRDLALVSRLQRTDTLGMAIAEGKIKFQRGFQRGKPENARPKTEFTGLRLLERHEHWRDCPSVARVTQFRKNDNSMFERPRPIDVYQLPALILKESWSVSAGGRFRGILVEPLGREKYLLFSKSFLSIQCTEKKLLEALAVAINSSFAVYYMYMTSGRLASYRPALRNADVTMLPLPLSNAVLPSQALGLLEDNRDKVALDIYNLREDGAERVLVEDFCDITLPDFKDARHTPGRHVVQDPESANHGCLSVYCQWFMQVMQACFGRDKALCATVFRPGGTIALPVCVVAFHLEWSRNEPIKVESISDNDFLSKLRQLDEGQEFRVPNWEGIYYRRVSRIYHVTSMSDRNGERKVPTVFIIKPNQVRYWTRSVAMRDADEVAADVMRWADTITNECGGGLHDAEVDSSSETF